MPTSDTHMGRSTRGARLHEPPSPTEHLVMMKAREPEMIETRDYEAIARAMEPETMVQAAAEHVALIFNKVIAPGDRRRGGRGEGRAEDEAWATERFGKFVDGVYDQLADLTKEQAQREVGAVATILNGLKRGQRLRDAMTREEFRARYFKLAGTPKD